MAEAELGAQADGPVRGTGGGGDLIEQGGEQRPAVALFVPESDELVEQDRLAGLQRVAPGEQIGDQGLAGPGGAPLFGEPADVLDADELLVRQGGQEGAGIGRLEAGRDGGGVGRLHVLADVFGMALAQVAGAEAGECGLVGQATGVGDAFLEAEIVAIGAVDRLARGAQGVGLRLQGGVIESHGHPRAGRAAGRRGGVCCGRATHRRLRINAQVGWAAAITAAAWPSTFTLRQIFLIVPVSSIRKVERSMPM